MSKPSNAAALLSALTSLGERGGAALGNAYAAGARVVLNGWEHLEDLNAERRFRQRASRPAPRAPRVVEATATPNARVPRTH